MRIAVIAVVVAALAGCGGGGAGSAGSGPTGGTTPDVTTTPVTTIAGGSSHPSTTLDSANAGSLGTVLVDGNGRTVYVLTAPGKKNLPCSAACTAIWPDLPLPKGQSVDTVGMGLDYSLLGTMKVGSETYPTYNGYVYYEYSGDTAPGQANGEGIKSFGGTWYALTADGEPVKP
jgi:predicted lipoprotein with Yx(FWY)xxD motif